MLGFSDSNYGREATRFGQTSTPIRVFYIPDRLVQLQNEYLYNADWLWDSIIRCTSLHMNALAHFRSTEWKKPCSDPYP